MSNISIGRGDFTDPGFGAGPPPGDDRYTAPREISGWIPLLASGIALIALVVAGSVLFGEAVKTALGAL
ncbi:hypothetical protein [Myceligenerans pegani]|uniref:Uncharacterized protein n=1 Tax=Myceligenerans pegani TaxID=2776917 RepID=A0ABR9MU88_9MICO|nr:hypothetical protein [Myceligenerans sp. TRM 65318]MBE1874937.1 hypothetical protein [Myceligenerans sp. TRM 65318]MBE3017208.1 hypothetical protein [Myceligenerans sp. TRM 65318]